jgi:hypothetical protein
MQEGIMTTRMSCLAVCWSLGVVAACATGGGVGGPREVEVRVENGVPANVEEFVALRDRLAVTPEGGAVIMVLALMKYAEDQQVGLQFLTVAVDQEAVDASADVYKGKTIHNAKARFIRDQLSQKPYVPHSYVQGTSPGSGYQHGPAPLVFRLKEQPNDVQGTKARMFVHSTGADSARPVALLRNDKGIWKAREWSSLLLGVRAPEARKADDL